MEKRQWQKGNFPHSPPCPRVIEGSSVSLWDTDRSRFSSWLGISVERARFVAISARGGAGEGSSEGEEKK